MSEVERLRARLAELESAASWGTACLSCASLLDASYDSDVRAAEATAEAERMRTVFDAALAVDRAWRFESGTGGRVVGPLRLLSAAVDALPPSTSDVSPVASENPEMEIK